MAIREVIRAFYNGLEQKNDDWKKNLADDVVFADASRKLHAEGRDAFIQSFTSFLRAVERVQVKQLLVDGADAAAVVSYDYMNPKGERLHQDDAEIWKVIDGQIVSLTIYFDITEFRSFIGR